MGPVTKEVREAGPMLTIVRTDIPLGTKQAHRRWLESGTLKVPQRAVLTLPCGQHAPVGWRGHRCYGRVYWSGGRASLSSCWGSALGAEDFSLGHASVDCYDFGFGVTTGPFSHTGWHCSRMWQRLLSSTFASSRATMLTLPVCFTSLFLGEFLRCIPFWVPFN